jgi:hypothetical protein
MNKKEDESNYYCGMAVWAWWYILAWVKSPYIKWKYEKQLMRELVEDHNAHELPEPDRAKHRKKEIT